MGGMAVLSRLQQICPSVCAVASSGYSGDSIMSNPDAHGFQGRLIKPYTVDEMGEVVSRLLRRERQ
jgi:hypothetical protein